MILEFPDVVWEQAWIIVRLQKNPPRYPALQTALSKFNLSNQKTLSPVLELFHDRIIEYHIPSLQYLLQRLASDPLPPELYSDATVSGYWRLACEMWAKRYDKQSFEQQLKFTTNSVAKIEGHGIFGKRTWTVVVVRLVGSTFPTVTAVVTMTGIVTPYFRGAGAVTQ
jgi:hypothetical protein